MKKVFLSVLKGIRDSVPFLATAKDHTIKEPDGSTVIKIDWPRAFTSLVIIGLLTAFILGKITIQDLLSLLDIFK